VTEKVSHSNRTSN